MTESQFYMALGAFGTHSGNSIFVNIIQDMIRMLDECDHEDFFGTEGWKHQLGWDD